jgi:hypothetical protein
LRFFTKHLHELIVDRFVDSKYLPGLPQACPQLWNWWCPSVFSGVFEVRVRKIYGGVLAAELHNELLKRRCGRLHDCDTCSVLPVKPTQSTSGGEQGRRR